jgi:hypothetical protein
MGPPQSAGMIGRKLIKRLLDDPGALGRNTRTSTGCAGSR